jgi:hypothetical protein
MANDLFDLDGRMDGWTDSIHEPNTPFSCMCEVPNRVQFMLIFKRFTMHALTFICHEGAQLQNVVTVVVSCWDVVSPTPNCCKSNINELSGVEKFVRI